MDVAKREYPVPENTEQGRMAEWERLCSVVLRKNLKPGFAAIKYKESFGDWPPSAWSDALKVQAESGAQNVVAGQLERGKAILAGDVIMCCKCNTMLNARDGTIAKDAPF